MERVLKILRNTISCTLIVCLFLISCGSNKQIQNLSKTSVIEKNSTNTDESIPLKKDDDKKQSPVIVALGIIAAAVAVILVLGLFSQSKP
jgi:hypothetical protein